MRRSILAMLAAVLLTAGSAAAETVTYELDPHHSQVGFRIRHLVSRVAGQFKDFSGSIEADAAKPEAGKVQFKIKAASVDTGIEKRDNHLRNADFFDVAKYPEIAFQSEKVVAKGSGQFDVTGPLTMHGVTKPVTLAVKVEGPQKTPWGTEVTGFLVSGKLNRKDFGITNGAMDSGSVILGDEVDLDITLEASPAKKPAAEKPAAK